MVKLIAPMLSGEARGKFGKILIFKQRLSQPVACRYFKPKNTNTSAQQTSRNRVSKAMTAWGNLTDPQRTEWDDYAKPFGRTGVNMFTSKYIIYMRDHGEAEPTPPFLP